jgi:hypothetical protein
MGPDPRRSYRLIGRELGLTKNTVAEIVKRKRADQPWHRFNIS